MVALRIDYPVHTLDNRELLPAGTLLSEETMEALISSQYSALSETRSLLEYGSFKQDVLDFLSLPPYRTILPGQKEIANFLKLAESIHSILPVLQSLDYFKQYDSYTYRHVLLVFVLSTLLAKDLLPNHRNPIRETAAGAAHDLGKICVPVEILRKSDPLTRTERGVLEHHTIAGYVLLTYYLRDTQMFSAKIARDHHERRDGSGYPRGIALADRMVEIVAVSDVYDALISKRPYRPVAYDNRAALDEIVTMAEKNQIGWDTVKALVVLNRQDKPHYSTMTLSAEKRGTPPPRNVYGVIAREDTDPLDTEHQ